VVAVRGDEARIVLVVRHDRGCGQLALAAAQPLFDVLVPLLRWAVDCGS
jgi:hypothetical protein